MGGDRYLNLLAGLVEAANAPLLLPESELPAKDLLPGLVRQPLRALTRQVKALGDGGSEDELHQVRIRAKRAGCAAEAVAPVLGKRARAVARAAASLQETLGEHQDAVVAERWLRAWVQGSQSVPAAFTAGELAGLERAAAADARARWPEAGRRSRRGEAAGRDFSLSFTGSFISANRKSMPWATRSSSSRLRRSAAVVSRSVTGSAVTMTHRTGVGDDAMAYPRRSANCSALAKNSGASDR